ncbi:hypothetical protein L1987_37719 [Smallanthus sonchifolius]|uniref:Uncharacterized protein n=1 Tax=Smallanthus sonchifolius TaxID=185202 RepID=A0ACB9HH67_9ASTR|nr:hypothetical protein L1987_37719 [Smallanthus sonchifolius]
MSGISPPYVESFGDLHIIVDFMDIVFQIFGVENISQQEIKKAYQKLVLWLHPNKNPDYEVECKRLVKQLQKVVSILGDEEKHTLMIRPAILMMLDFSDSWCELCEGSHYVEECYLSIWRPMDHEINLHRTPFEETLPSLPPSVDMDYVFHEPDPWKPDTLFRNLEEIINQIIKLYATEPYEDLSEVLDQPSCDEDDQASQEQNVEMVTMIHMDNTGKNSHKSH